MCTRDHGNHGLSYTPPPSMYTHTVTLSGSKVMMGSIRDLQWHVVRWTGVCLVSDSVTYMMTTHISSTLLIKWVALVLVSTAH